jgi:hypothetical protein
MTTPLTPTAQAVLDAAISVCHPETEIVAFQCTRLEVAAALQAAADQVVPKDKYPSSDWTDKDEVRYQLLAIAAELEGGNG